MKKKTITPCRICGKQPELKTVCNNTEHLIYVCMNCYRNDRIHGKKSNLGPTSPTMTGAKKLWNIQNSDMTREDIERQLKHTLCKLNIIRLLKNIGYIMLLLPSVLLTVIEIAILAMSVVLAIHYFNSDEVWKGLEWLTIAFVCTPCVLSNHVFPRAERKKGGEEE